MHDGMEGCPSRPLPLPVLVESSREEYVSTHDEAVRDLKISLLREGSRKKIASQGSPRARANSDPSLAESAEVLHPEIGRFRDVAQPGGFRREHILRNVDQHHTGAQLSLLHSLLEVDLQITRQITQDCDTQGGISDWAMVLMLVKTMLGGCVLVLPAGFKEAGLGGGALCLVFLGGAEIFCMVLLLRCRQTTTRSCSYGDLALRAFGPGGRAIVDGSLLLSQMGFVCAEMLFVATNGVKGLRGIGWEPAPSAADLVLAELVVVLPMSMLRSLRYFKWSNFIANIVVVSNVCMLFFYTVAGLLNSGPVPDIEVVSGDWLIFAGTTVFAFECINFVIPMYEAADNKEGFTFLLTRSLGSIVVLYIVFGGASYALYGGATEAPVTLNLPSGSALAMVAPLCFAVACLLSVPLMLFPGVALIESYLWPASSAETSKWSLREELKKDALRVAVVLGCAMLCVVWADALEVFVSFIGSFCCVPLAFIYPAGMHTRICRPGPLGAARNVAIACLGCVIFVVTSVQAVASLSKS